MADDPHFEPILFLPVQEVKMLEDGEELFKMRAKLYRFASEWPARVEGERNWQHQTAKAQTKRYNPHPDEET